ncbi:MAG: SWIM zinc finger family protein [Leptothrix sp. (in: b-proteobacteria)]
MTSLELSAKASSSVSACSCRAWSLRLRSEAHKRFCCRHRKALVAVTKNASRPASEIHSESAMRSRSSSLRSILAIRNQSVPGTA